MTKKRRHMKEMTREEKEMKMENAAAQQESPEQKECACGGEEVKEEKCCGKEEKHCCREEKASEKQEKRCAKDEKIEALEKELKETKEQLAKEKNDYLRLMADLENLRRHSAQERINLMASASEDTIKGMLPVLDDLERAMELLSKSGDEAAKEGTTLIYNKLMAYLKSKGLEVIEAKGKKFDTDFHEAVSQFPVQDESQKGLVFDVISTGYTLGGKILRYAKVVVGI